MSDESAQHSDSPDITIDESGNVSSADGSVVSTAPKSDAQEPTAPEQPKFSMNDYLAFARQLAFDAGAIMQQHFGLTTEAEWKEDNTPLTQADTDINQLVIDRVMTEFPEHGVLGEEQNYESARETIWVVDPVEGTMPFAIGAPLSMFSLALVENGEPVLAIVFDPFTERSFVAVKGHGAYLNDKQLKIVPNSELKYLAVSGRANMNLQTTHKSNGQFLDLLGAEKIRWFNFNCYVYGAMLVAAGTLPAAIMSNPKPWDVAAAKLIVREAGGRVTNLLGQECAYSETTNGILLSNGAVHDEILSKLRL